MITHIEFKDKEGIIRTLPLNQISLYHGFIVEELGEGEMYAICINEVYESEYDRVRNYLIKKGFLE